MKLTIVHPPVVHPVHRTSEMKIGDVATILFTDPTTNRPQAYGGNTILKDYAGYVSLNDPSSTWDSEPNFAVEILPRGTQITLTVG